MINVKEIRYWISLLLLLTTMSCSKFLEEAPAGALDPGNFYKTPEQVQAAVNGTYDGLARPFEVNIGVAVSPVYALEYMTGYSRRPRPSGAEDDQFLKLQHRILLIHGCKTGGMPRITRWRIATV
ncbi:hypothetical protein MKQ70_13425 [Chitinophaga sedimenti]|uniref:hypothetical protein n=1 Tax=Chitinophaga sedimenti TaxID=2033606 RepID=UPI002005F6A5|nr:hypothetical protein [Chitinophaga sedimenti]MCK7555967.1 hypothetical protein [Chitinophaga sedimenti]